MELWNKIQIQMVLALLLQEGFLVNYWSFVKGRTWKSVEFEKQKIVCMYVIYIPPERSEGGGRNFIMTHGKLAWRHVSVCHLVALPYQWTRLKKIQQMCRFYTNLPQFVTFVQTFSGLLWTCETGAGWSGALGNQTWIKGCMIKSNIIP